MLRTIKGLVVCLFVSLLASCSVVNSYKGVPATISSQPKWSYDSKVAYLETKKKYEAAGRDNSILFSNLEKICFKNPEALSDLIDLTWSSKPGVDRLTCIVDGAAVTKKIDEYWTKYLAASGYKGAYMKLANHYVAIAKQSRNKNDAIFALGIAYAARSTGVSEATDTWLNDFSVELSRSFNSDDWQFVKTNAIFFTYSIKPDEYSEKWFDCGGNKCSLSAEQTESLEKLTAEIKQAREGYLAEKEKNLQEKIAEEEKNRLEKDKLIDEFSADRAAIVAGGALPMNAGNCDVYKHGGDFAIAWALFRYGLCVEDGYGGGGIDDAINLYKKSAELNEPYAEYRLGQIFLGRGQQAEAINFLTRAAEHGIINAVNELYVASPDAVLTLFKKFMNDGDNSSAYKAAIIQINGGGKSTKAGFDQMEVLGERGCIDAEKFVGDAYKNGTYKFTPQDFEFALYWYKKAADLGDSDAKKIVDKFNSDKVAARKAGFLTLKEYYKALNEAHGGKVKGNYEIYEIKM